MKVTFTPYAVDFYDEAGAFAGGLTKRRLELAMRDRDLYLVADALAEILKALGLRVELKEDAA